MRKAGELRFRELAAGFDRVSAPDEGRQRRLTEIDVD
jgi:hypothetical protein